MYRAFQLIIDAPFTNSTRGPRSLTEWITRGFQLHLAKYDIEKLAKELAQGAVASKCPSSKQERSKGGCHLRAVGNFCDFPEESLLHFRSNLAF